MPKEINSDLLRGNINTIILSALYSGDRYGYDIVNEIEQKSQGQFTIKQPTLYSCLKRLEAQGLVSSYWGEQSNGGRRKYFSLTELGKEVFKQSQDDYEYSRSVIDKLISENKYDFGSEEQAKTNTVSDNADVSSPLLNDSVQILSVQPDVSADDKADVGDDTITVKSDVQPEQLTLSDINTEYSNPLPQSDSDIGDARFLPSNDSTANSGADNNDFIPYHYNDESANADNSLGNAQQSDNIEISWFDAGIANDSTGNPGNNSYTVSASSGDRANNYSNEKQEDINDIFYRNSVKQSYIDDLKTDNPQSDGFKTNSDLFGSFADLTNDAASTKNYFEPEYSEPDYPYADTSDTASALIEAELTPLKKEDKTEFISYHDQQSVNDAATVADREIADNSTSSNGYQDLLSGLIDKFDDNRSEITKTDIENNALELNDKVKIRAFGNIVESARELGEEVIVRTNDNKSKHQYSAKYYYKDNLLRLVSSGILFVVMLLESLITYIVCKNAFNAQGKYDSFLFIVAIVVTLSLPVAAGIRYYSNPDSKKRIESNMIETFWFKVVVMILICLLSFGLNLFIGMPLNGQITDYSISLFMPIILSTNLPLSYLIFRLMFTSKFFIAKD